MSDTTPTLGQSYAAIPPHRSEITHCEGQVRWKDGKLQQLFRTDEYTGSSLSGRRHEWRDVPTELPSPPVQER